MTQLAGAHIKGMQSAVSISANVHCSFPAVCLETLTAQGISCEVRGDKPLVATPGDLYRLCSPGPLANQLE